MLGGGVRPEYKPTHVIDLPTFLEEVILIDDQHQDAKRNRSIAIKSYSPVGVVKGIFSTVPRFLVPVRRRRKGRRRTLKSRRLKTPSSGENKKQKPIKLTKPQLAFEIYKKRKWECRSCLAIQLESTSIRDVIRKLGKGNQKLTNSDDVYGLVMENKIMKCKTHGNTKHDKWTGARKEPEPVAEIPPKLRRRIIEYYSSTCPITQKKIQNHNAVPDHRTPRIRWRKNPEFPDLLYGGKMKMEHDSNITDDELHEIFQLLTKFSDLNFNDIKSKACEECYTNQTNGLENVRPPFLGIPFWYDGDQKWPIDAPACGKGVEKGCKGCGWFDVLKWFESLRDHLEKPSDNLIDQLGINTKVEVPG